MVLMVSVRVALVALTRKDAVNIEECEFYLLPTLMSVAKLSLYRGGQILMALSDRAREIIMRSEYDGARTPYVLLRSQFKAEERKIKAQMRELEKKHKK